MMLTGIGNYFLVRTDQLLAGRIANTYNYGLYSVGSEIGQLPAGELGPAMVRSLFPILASLQNDVARAKNATLKTLAAVNTVTMPLGLGLAAISHPATVLLLGAKWVEATPFLTAFAVISTTSFIMAPINTLLNIEGYLKIQTNIVWIQFFIFCIFSFPLVYKFQLIGIVGARMISGLSSGIMLAFVAKRKLDVDLSLILMALFRPILGSVLMYLLIIFTMIQSWSPLFQVLQGIFTGAVFFTTWIFVTWSMMGKPDGFESTLYEQVIKFFNKKIYKRI
jgi:O-antigen/teichoic acid export membrane protein